MHSKVEIGEALARIEGQRGGTFNPANSSSRDELNATILRGLGIKMPEPKREPETAPPPAPDPKAEAKRERDEKRAELERRTRKLRDERDETLREFSDSHSNDVAWFGRFRTGRPMSQTHAHRTRLTELDEQIAAVGAELAELA